MATRSSRWMGYNPSIHMEMGKKPNKNGVERAKRMSKAKQEKLNRPLCLDVIEGGLVTAADFTRLFSATAIDLIHGTMDIGRATALSKAGQMAAKFAELQFKYAPPLPGGEVRSLVIAPPKGGAVYALGKDGKVPALAPVNDESDYDEDEDDDE